MYGFARLLGFRSHTTFRLFVRGVALALGLLGACLFAYHLTLQNFQSAFSWYALVVAGASIEFIAADILADKAFPYDTERKLELMANRLGYDTIEMLTDRLRDTVDRFRGCDNSKISATVHVLTELTPTADHRTRVGLLQLTDYVGPEGGRKGRVTTTSQGIVGRCARSGCVETVNFGEESEYLERMVREFGFSKDEANGHTKKGRSYLAVPMTKNGKMVGVIYFFSTEPQVFPVAAARAPLDTLSEEFVNYVGLAKLI